MIDRALQVPQMLAERNALHRENMLSVIKNMREKGEKAVAK